MLLDSPGASATAPRIAAGRARARRAPPTRSGSAARALCRAACFRVRERSVSSCCLIRRLITGRNASPSYLRIDVEKGRETRFELLLDLAFAAIENMHGDVRLPPIPQFDRRVANLRDLIGGQQAQTIHQRQVCHPTIVSQGS